MNIFALVSPFFVPKLSLQIPGVPDGFAVDADVFRGDFLGSVLLIVADYKEFVGEDGLDALDHDLIVDGDGVDSPLKSNAIAAMVDQDEIFGEERRLHAVPGDLNQGHIVVIPSLFFDPVSSESTLEIR